MNPLNLVFPKPDLMQIMSVEVVNHNNPYDIAMVYQLDINKDSGKIKAIMEYAKWWSEL